MQPVRITQGNSPIVLGLPHSGTFVPDDIWSRLNENGQLLADTDWHVDRLYDGLLPGATIVKANFHRYVIDANRDPSGVSLYPDQNTTTLCPTTDFDGMPIYHDSQEPAAVEVEQRRGSYHAAYHDALVSQIARVKALNGVAILYDCHSIRSEISFLFDGVLPDFNIGTNGGTTCADEIEKTVVKLTANASEYTSILNGRFKGGWTTRHYGRPETGVHAIQMELAQRTHLATEFPPFAYDEAKADALRGRLAAILLALASWAGETREQGA